MTAPEPLLHERAFELLPWLVNDTLQGDERTAVEGHVRSCIVCRRELKEQRQLHAAVQAQPTIHVSAHAALAKLDRELDGDATRAGRTVRRWGLRYSALRPFAVAAAAGLAVLAFLLWLTPPPQLGADRYSTLATAPSADAGRIDIVFAQRTTAAQMVALLADIDGEIVAGPSAAGRYSVRIAGGRADEGRLAELVDALRTDARVRFAGRSLSELPP